MIKKVTRVGNSKGIILDAALLDMAHLKEGDELSVTIHEGGAITFTPVQPRVIGEEEFTEALDGVLGNFAGTLKKLS